MKGFLFFLISGLALAASVAHAGNVPADTGRVFVINAPIKDLAEFRILVRQLEVLRPYGKIQVNVSTLADKSFHEIPQTGSAWHEYASGNPTPFKFFPDARLAPFIPVEFVKKNRALLLEKTKILREAGMEAAFIGYEPNFMPEAFFDAYPAFMGPRVDHPRRSAQKEFAPCIHMPETQEMFAGMMEQMLKEAPEITSFAFKTNDAGAGICWGDWLYTGPNGPARCRHLNMGERMEALLQAYQKGAARAGRKLSIYIDEASSNFSAQERAEIEARLPGNCYFLGGEARALASISGTLASLYPVTGIINPVLLQTQLRSLPANRNKTIFVTLRAAYDRGLEPQDVTALFLGLIARQFSHPQTEIGTEAELSWLKDLCEVWAGKRSGPVLVNAFTALNEAMAYKSATFPRVHSLYWGVTERLITRPLVIAPQRLAEKEEAYFLPYVFNVNTEEARMDYMDIHGGRFTIPPGVTEIYAARILRAAMLFSQLDPAAPQKAFFDRMALSLKIHASIIRSCGNFAAAQAVRDRNNDLVRGEPKRPDKESSWTGHPDFIAFNNIMRSELDNTIELIRLLEDGGIKQVVVASQPRYEDRFMLGPDLVGQLKKKRKIMMDHWRDVEDYLASPLK